MKCTKDYTMSFPVRGGTGCCQVSIYSPEPERGDDGKIVILVTERTHPCLTLFPTIANLVQDREGYNWPDELVWVVDCATEERLSPPTLWHMNVVPVWGGWLRRKLSWKEGGLSQPILDAGRAHFFSQLDSADPLAILKAAAPWLAVVG